MSENQPFVAPAGDSGSDGHISPTYTAWCGRCVFWQYVTGFTQAEANASAIKDGWKRDRWVKWLCPTCAANPTR